MLTESIDIILFLLFSYIIFVCFNFFIVLKVLIFIFLIIPISHITYVCFKFIFLFVLRNFAIFLICDIPLSDRYISNVQIKCSQNRAEPQYNWLCSGSPPSTFDHDNQSEKSNYDCQLHFIYHSVALLNNLIIYLLIN